jgi:hypothetical protein
MTVARTGPMSRDIQLPARAKPGRKPIVDEEDPKERRKAQNRNAQRKFRDTRAEKLAETREQLLQEQSKHNAEVGNLRREVEALRRQIDESRHQNQSLQSQLAALRGDGPTRPMQGPSNSTDENPSLETDFTVQTGFGRSSATFSDL